MLKYFELLVDLLVLDIDITQYLDLAKWMDDNYDKYDFLFYHRYGFLFQWYLDLLNEKIELEEFLKIWDITDTTDILKKNKVDSFTFLQSLDLWEYNKPTAILVDKIAWKLTKVVETNDNIKFFSL